MFDLATRSVLQLDISDPEINPVARFKDINTLIGIIVPIATIIAAIVFGGMFMMAGYKVITAAGEAEKLDEARQTAIYAVFGLLIIVCAFLIVRLLAFIFKLDLPF